MKRTVCLTIVIAAMLAATAVPALAGGDNNQYRWRGGVFGLVGQVVALDPGAGTISVLVHTGNRLVKDYLGQELDVNTNEDTLFLRYGDPQCEVIAFEDVEVGAYVSMNGIVLPSQLEEQVFLAKRVTVDVPLHGLR